MSEQDERTDPEKDPEVDLLRDVLDWMPSEVLEARAEGKQKKLLASIDARLSRTIVEGGGANGDTVTGRAEVPVETEPDVSAQPEALPEPEEPLGTDLSTVPTPPASDQDPLADDIDQLSPPAEPREEALTAHEPADEAWGDEGVQVPVEGPDEQAQEPEPPTEVVLAEEGEQSEDDEAPGVEIVVHEIEEDDEVVTTVRVEEAEPEPPVTTARDPDEWEEVELEAHDDEPEEEDEPQALVGLDEPEPVHPVAPVEPWPDERDPAPPLRATEGPYDDLSTFTVVAPPRAALEGDWIVPGEEQLTTGGVDELSAELETDMDVPGLDLEEPAESDWPELEEEDELLSDEEQAWAEEDEDLFADEDDLQWDDGQDLFDEEVEEDNSFAEGLEGEEDPDLFEGAVAEAEPEQDDEAWEDEDDAFWEDLLEDEGDEEWEPASADAADEEEEPFAELADDEDPFEELWEDEDAAATLEEDAEAEAWDEEDLAFEEVAFTEAETATEEPEVAHEDEEELAFEEVAFTEAEPVAETAVQDEPGAEAEEATAEVLWPETEDAWEDATLSGETEDVEPVPEGSPAEPPLPADEDPFEDLTSGDAEEAAPPTEEPPSGPGYQHGPYTLYHKVVETGDGDTRDLYFFARAPPDDAAPSGLPDGYEVGVNERTGVPFVRRARE